MASSESPNLVSDFEQAYSEALSTLCEEEILSDRAAIEEQKIVSNAIPLGPLILSNWPLLDIEGPEYKIINFLFMIVFLLDLVR